MLIRLLIWGGVVVGAIVLAATVVLWRQTEPIYKLQWEQLGKYTYRACDGATGNLIYKDLDGGFAGARFVVIEGGCR